MLLETLRWFLGPKGSTYMAYTFFQLVFPRTCAGEKLPNPRASSQRGRETAPQCGALWDVKTNEVFSQPVFLDILEVDGCVAVLAPHEMQAFRKGPFQIQ